MRAVRFADECSKWTTPAQTFSSSGADFWARTQARFAARTCVEIKIYGAFVLNRHVVLHAIDATLDLF